MQPKEYTGWLGPMDYQWKNPPQPFNPSYDPKAEERYRKVTESMQADGYYSNHTREQCKVEWARRYEELKAADSKGA